MNVETAEVSKADGDLRAEQSARADRFFAGLVASAGYFVLVALAGAAISMFWGGREAITTFGFDFFTSSNWDVGAGQFGAAVAIFGTLVSATIAMLFASREQEKAIREANKAARAERKAKIDAQNDSVGQDTPEAVQEPSADVVPLAAPGTIESEAIEVTDALVFHGEVLEVSADEATLLAAYLTQLRMEARKAA